MNKNGFSLIELMIVVAILAGLSVGMGTLMSNMAKMQKYVSTKAELSNLNSTVQLAMASPVACRQALGLDTKPILIPIKSLPGQIGSSATSFTQNIPQLTIPGRNIISVGSVDSGLRVDNMELEFNNPITVPSGLQYIVKFNIKASAESSQNVMGPGHYALHIPVYIDFVDNGDLINLRVNACYTKNTDIDPKVACAEMGGRWLEATKSTSFMNKPRCNFGGEVALGMDEMPDDFPASGGTNANGERVEECYYLSGAKVATYKCSSKIGPTSGYRCAYSTKLHKWGVFYFTAGAMAAKPYRECAKGVKVSTKSDAVTILEWNERLYNLTQTTPFADEWTPNLFSSIEQTDLTANIDKCKYDPTLDAYKACANAGDPNSALNGKTNSCLYVRGVKLSGGSTTLARVNACKAMGGCSGMDVNNYTGWIFVSSARTTKITTTNAVEIVEAAGLPCFGVNSVPDPVSAASALVSHENSSTPTADHLATPDSIKQCVTKGNDKITKSFARSQINLCDNTAMQTQPDVASVFAKSCWYFENVNLVGSTVPYTGWLYMLGVLPDDKFIRNPTTNALMYKAPNTNRINALPCESIRSLN